MLGLPQPKGQSCSLVLRGRQDFPAIGPFTASSGQISSSMFWEVGCSLGKSWDGGLGMKAVAPGGRSSGASCCCLAPLPALRRGWSPGPRPVVCLGGSGRAMGVVPSSRHGGPRGSRGGREPPSCRVAEPLFKRAVLSPKQQVPKSALSLHLTHTWLPGQPPAWACVPGPLPHPQGPPFYTMSLASACIF